MHVNNGKCDACEAIFDLYPGFNSILMNWFLSLQSAHPEAHISCAGRGKFAQNSLFNNGKGATKAKWGQSAHNWNCAIDVFRLLEGKYDLDEYWFDSVIEPNLTPDITWYGRPGAPFYERPHLEISAWPQLVKTGIIKLVE